MPQFVRKNAWDANNGGQFLDSSGNYTDLYWYAIGVQEMKSKPISDPTSWWFYAAIHGQYLTDDFGTGLPPEFYPNWAKITSIPASADLANLPSQSLIALFWDQCQHGTWFFQPWHRGYLVALENILRDIIVNQKNGPSDWALPYWNYLNQSTTYKERQIPPAFTAKFLPDNKTPNSLYVSERYGPYGNLNVYVPVGPSSVPGAFANDECQWDTNYSDPNNPQKSPNNYGYFYGGQQSGFSHSNGGFGDLEMNPHNFVHNFVGGQLIGTSAPPITIQSTLPWQSTGINIATGTTVMVSYVKGDWTADPQDYDGQLYDANGSPDIIVPTNQTLYPIVSVPMGILIGRVNGGTPFVIGNQSAVPDNVSGPLELCINDDLTGAYGSGLKDNQGSIQVTFISIPSFTVQSKLPWQSTGLNIAPGATFLVSYASGDWTADPQDNNGQLYDANGSPDIIVPANQTLYPIVNVPMGILIGRVNGGTPFVIGNQSVVPDNVSGLLELCINDDLTGAYGSGLKDNQGSIIVSFTPTPSEEYEGLMADPGIAGLDPIFFLHHANIDRMWEAWNVTGGNQNTTNPNWLAGPQAHGNSQFAMPIDSVGTPWYYTPAGVENLANLTYYNGVPYLYTYDDLSLTSYSNNPPTALHNPLENRLMKLGLTNAENAQKAKKMPSINNSELLGASNTSITLNSGINQATVKVDPGTWSSVVKSLKDASADAPPNEVFLKLENVTGTSNANFLSVYVNNQFVKTASLFGIRMASMKNSEHGGSGLTLTFNITDVVDNIFLDNKIDVNSLDVQIKTEKAIPNGSQITVGRISIYRLN